MLRLNGEEEKLTDIENLQNTGINAKGFGFLQSYSLATIAAGARKQVPISQNDIYRYGFFNVLAIVNLSTVTIQAYIDGDTSRALTILANTSVSLNGTRYQRLEIKNTDGANATGADNVKVTVQKDMSFLEQLQVQSALKQKGLI